MTLSNNLFELSMNTAMRLVGELTVQPIGLGCMNLDHAYGPPASAESGERLLLAALDEGYNFFDTATLYGGGRNEERLGAVLAKRRREFVLASKCGMAIVTQDGKPTRVIDGRPETLRRECENSLRRLRTDVIDLYYLHRWDKRVPIEDSVGALSDLVRKGLIRHIGLSEVSAPTLRRAHAVHPIAALQTEYSLWSRNAEIAVLAACRELGVAFVAFSPVARGFLGDLDDVRTLSAKDIRLSMPRFSPERFAANRQLLAPMDALAQELGCTRAQLALAWLLHQGPHTIPIPGTTQVQHMRDNWAASRISLNAAQLQSLEAALHPSRISGSRYDAQASAEVDTEEF